MKDALHTSPFDAIRRKDENGKEYWSARELSKILGYDRWENFRKFAIPKAQIACENSDEGVSDHFRGSTKMIKTGKGGQSEKQKISDYMGSEELGANVFRATQTDAKLRRDQVSTKGQANVTHFQVGREVREAIKRLGGTMPEDLPTPVESIQELQRKEQRQVAERSQLSLFEELPSTDKA